MATRSEPVNILSNGEYLFALDTALADTAVTHGQDWSCGMNGTLSAVGCAKQ